LRVIKHNNALEMLRDSALYKFAIDIDINIEGMCFVPEYFDN